MSTTQDMPLFLRFHRCQPVEHTRCQFHHRPPRLYRIHRVPIAFREKRCHTHVSHKYLERRCKRIWEASEPLAGIGPIIHVEALDHHREAREISYPIYRQLLVEGVLTRWTRAVIIRTVMGGREFGWCVVDQRLLYPGEVSGRHYD